MQTEGVLIIDTGEIRSEGGKTQDPARDIVKPGDYIVAFNQEVVRCKQDLLDDLKDLNETSVTLKVRRDEKTIPLSVTPVKDESGTYKLGIWVRDDTQGIGTLTYVDENGRYGALGHGISDVDTGELLTVKEGEIVSSEIIEIVKGEAGEPGELKGSFDVNNEVIGNITKNTDFGIYGISEKGIENNLYSEALPAAKRDEIQLGDATLLCSLNNEGVKEYKCKIIKLNSQIHQAEKHGDRNYG